MSTAPQAPRAEARQPIERVPTRTTPAFLTRAALGIVLGLGLLKGLSPFSEPDLWWHLRTGERLREGAGLVSSDPSAAFAVRPYVATQWLPEVAASWVHDWAGTAGLLWLRCAAIVLLVVAVYVTCRRQAGRLAASVTAGLALLAAGGGLNPRPQLVSFVLFAVCLHTWLGVRQDGRARWWLVPVFWLWACCHGLWMFGLAVGAVILTADWVGRRGRVPRREVLSASALWLGCALATAATPLGPRLLLSPFQVAQNAITIADEWRPTPLNNVFSWAAVLMLLICVCLWALGPQGGPPRPRDLWEFALLAFAAFCTLWMWRLVPLGAIAAAPLVAQAVQERLTGMREPYRRRERSQLLAATAVVLAVGGIFAALTPDPARYPGDVREVDVALDRLPDSTVVMNDFGFSGWLLWRHPELVPVADLRGEIYSRGHLHRYEDALATRPGWEDFIDAVDADAAVLPVDSALGEALEERLGWSVVASTKEFELLRRAAP